MQRDLDRDLSDDEKQALQLHLDECKSCAIMHKKLQYLSAELAKLPKVNPPYSIVDQILPRIEQLDAAHEAHSEWQSERQSSQSESHRSQSEAADNKHHSPKHWARSIYAKTFGGIAAAAVVMLLILNNIPWQGHDSHDVVMEMNDQSSHLAHDDSMVMEIAMPDFDDGGIPQLRSLSSEEGAVGAQDMHFTATDHTKVNATSFHLSFESPTEQTLLSPNQLYTAIIKQEGILYQVTIVAESGELIYESKLFEADALQNIVWTEDSKSLNYEVIVGETVSFATISID